MDEIEENKEEITENMNKLDKLINWSPLFTSDRKKWTDSCRALIKSTKDLIIALQEEVKELPIAQSSRHVGAVNSLKKKMQKLEQDFQKKLLGQRDSEIIDETMSQTAPSENNRNKLILQTINKGDSAQRRIEDVLDSMDKTVQEGIQLAAQINTELNRQIEQLDSMTTKVKDTHSTLKRAQKTINYFVKALECDKCLIGLVILILLALIALVVLLIKKN